MPLATDNAIGESIPDDHDDGDLRRSAKKTRRTPTRWMASSRRGARVRSETGANVARLARVDLTALIVVTVRVVFRARGERISPVFSATSFSVKKSFESRRSF